MTCNEAVGSGAAPSATLPVALVGELLETACSSEWHPTIALSAIALQARPINCECITDFDPLAPRGAPLRVRVRADVDQRHVVPPWPHDPWSARI
jgi:hypothetical protein